MLTLGKNHFSWHTSPSGIFPAESSAPKYLSTGYSELNFSISIKLHFEKRSHATYCSGFTHPTYGKCFCFSAYASSCTTSSESEVSNWSSFQSTLLPSPLWRPHFQGSSLVPHLLTSVSLLCSFKRLPIFTLAQIQLQSSLEFSSMSTSLPVKLGPLAFQRVNLSILSWFLFSQQLIFIHGCSHAMQR